MDKKHIIKLKQLKKISAFILVITMTVTGINLDSFAYLTSKCKATVRTEVKAVDKKELKEISQDSDIVEEKDTAGDSKQYFSESLNEDTGMFLKKDDYAIPFEPLMKDTEKNADKSKESDTEEQLDTLLEDDVDNEKQNIGNNKEEGKCPDESVRVLEKSAENREISWKEKIDEDLMKRIKSADKDEKISVWIWFTDIDQEKVEKQVKKDTGLTTDNLAVSYEPVPDDLVQTLEEASEKTGKDARLDPTEGKLKAYIKVTETQRKKEKQRTDTYIKARRKVARDAYVAKNNAMVKELNLPIKEITFQSQLTPSAIVNLTKAQIFCLAKSTDVVSVDFYDDTEQTPPEFETQKGSMRVDWAKQLYGLTGAGVNVLMNDHGFVRSDVNGFIGEMPKPNNIKTVFEQTLYAATNTSILPPCKKDEDHPNFVARTMQNYGSDVNIFSVGYGYFADVEWAIMNCNIDLINGSVNYGTSTKYVNDSTAKWFDGLVSAHDVLLIASAGNDEIWQPGGWPQVISPSSGYNSIATGAYVANGYFDTDIMHNYRYNPMDNTDLVCYKPDMVVAAGSTSEGAPVLSGITSMMIQLKPSLAANPELVKAILMASCHRKVKPAAGTGTQEKMTDGLTQRQGAGAVDAYRAMSIVAQGNYDIGDITSGSSDAKIALPANGTNINVSLAWLRKNTNTSNNPSSGTTLGMLQELKLDVYNNSNLMGTSAKKNTGKQMVYFSPQSSNSEYTIRVTKTSQNTEPVRYAYAWSTEEVQALSQGVYSLKNLLSLKYLDSTGTNVYQQPYSTDIAQLWEFKYSNGYYEIAPLSNPSMRLTVNDLLPENGTLVKQVAASGADTQKWIVISLGNGKYRIAPKKKRNLALEIQGPSTASGAVAQVWSYSNSSDQMKWEIDKIEPIKKGTYHMQNLYSSSPKYLDSTGGNVYQQPYSTDIAQSWEFKYLNGYYEIIPLSNLSMRLTLNSSKPGNGTLVKQIAASGADTQKWTVVPLGNDQYRIAPKINHNLTLEIQGPSSASGAVAQVWSYNSTCNQMKWKIVLDESFENGTVIRNYASGKVLTAAGSEKNLIQSTYTGKNTQKWDIQSQDGLSRLVPLSNTGTCASLGYPPENANNNVLQYPIYYYYWFETWDIIPNGDGTFRIMYDSASNTCMDISSGSTAEGVGVKLSTYTGADTQKWKIGVDLIIVPNTGETMKQAITRGLGTIAANTVDKLTIKGNAVMGSGGDNFDDGKILPNLKEVDLSGFSGTLGDYAFFNYQNIEIVTLPDSIRLPNNVFRDCLKLTTIHKADKPAVKNEVDLSGVTSIGNYAFRNAESITKVKLGVTFDISEYCFMECKNLKTIYRIGNSPIDGEIDLSGVQTIGYRAFYNNINSVNEAPKFHTAKLAEKTTIPSECFRNNMNLTTVYRTGRLKINGEVDLSGVTWLGAGAFSGTSNLTAPRMSTVILPKNVAIPEYCFQYCENLKKVIFDETQTTKVSIGSEAFYGVNTSCIVYMSQTLVNDTGFVLPMSATVNILKNAYLVVAPNVNATYKIQAKTSGKVIYANSYNSALLYNQSISNSQTMNFERQSDGTYKIVVASSLKVLGNPAYVFASGIAIGFSDWTGGNNQKWEIYDCGNGWLKFRNRHSKLVLDVRNNGTANDSIVQQCSDNGSDAQQFKLLPQNLPTTSMNVVNGVYEIQGKSSGKFINSSGAYNGAILYESGTQDSQKFNFERQSDGTYKIIKLSLNKALENPRFSYARETQMAFNGWNGSDNQRWYIIDCGSGWVKFVNKHSGLVLDIKGGYTTNNTPIQQYTDNGTDSQRFKLNKQIEK